MEKRVFLIHGWGESPNDGWLPWLTSELEAQGYFSESLEMPDSMNPTIESWVNTIKRAVGEPDEETYFVGHSMGCQAILRYIESLPNGKKVGGAVLVAPWFHLKDATWNDEGFTKELAEPWLTTPINLEKVKSKAKHFVGIVSDNDSYVPLEDKEIIKNKLGAEIAVLNNRGHISGDDGIVDLTIALIKLTKIMSQ